MVTTETNLKKTVQSKNRGERVTKLGLEESNTGFLVLFSFYFVFIIKACFFSGFELQ